MDWSLFQAVNRFAERTSWAHGLFRAYADYGIALFAAALVVVAVVALRCSDATMLISLDYSRSCCWG